MDVTNSISSEQPTAQVSNDCPPDLALAALDCSLSPDKMKLFETCLRYGISNRGGCSFPNMEIHKNKGLYTLLITYYVCVQFHLVFPKLKSD